MTVGLHSTNVKGTNSGVKLYVSFIAPPLAMQSGLGFLIFVTQVPHIYNDILIMSVVKIWEVPDT